MNNGYSPIGRCPECKKLVWYDEEAGEPVPHKCPLDYIDTAQEAFWAEEDDETKGI